MSSIVVRDLSFSYSSPQKDVFQRLNLVIGARWRAGLVGRNGRGKTTLLKLLARELVPQAGEVMHALDVRYFPYTPADPSQAVSVVVRNAVAPFDAWQAHMNALLVERSDAALVEYAALLARYESLGGYTIDARVASALERLDIPRAAQEQSFSTLSAGQQTRALVASLFVGEETYGLIDEPTNHLDMAGRELLADYLREQRGFVLVSHDRAFLDRCIDHVVAIRADEVVTHRTTYTEWRRLEAGRLAFEERRNRTLKREIGALSSAARQRRQGALSRERDKAAHVDKGYVGHRAAKQMKRAIAIERRIARQIAERKTLLRGAEKARSLKLETTTSRARPLVITNNLTVVREGRALFAPVSFSIGSGDRLAILGRNGSGKTSLLDALCGAPLETQGTLRRIASTAIGEARQRPTWTRGQPLERLAEVGLDRRRFTDVLAALGVPGDTLERPLETLSAGQLKKIELARTLVAPVDVLVWDEPLNYLDVESREQIEQLVLESEPTLVFVEHDRCFVERVATEIVALERP